MNKIITTCNQTIRALIAQHEISLLLLILLMVTGASLSWFISPNEIDLMFPTPWHLDRLKVAEFLSRLHNGAAITLCLVLWFEFIFVFYKGQSSNKATYVWISALVPPLITFWGLFSGVHMELTHNSHWLIQKLSPLNLGALPVPSEPYWKKIASLLFPEPTGATPSENIVFLPHTLVIPFLLLLTLFLHTKISEKS